MKTRTMFALLLMSAGVACTAQAHESSIDFRLDPVTAQWLTPNAFNGYTSIDYRWADGSRSSNYETWTSVGVPVAERNGEPFGPRREGTLPPLAANSPSAHTLLDTGRLQAEVSRQQPWDAAYAQSGWDRTFSLLPNTSITFSGVAAMASDEPTTLQTTFEASPNLNPQYANRGTLLFHSVLADGQRWDNGISFIARIMNFDPRLPAGTAPSLGRVGSADDFAYGTDEQGHISLTLFNHSNELMFTNLSMVVFATAPLISPIPEPAAWSAMLLGLGVLAWRRKGLKASHPVATAGGLA